MDTDSVRHSCDRAKGPAGTTTTLNRFYEKKVHVSLLGDSLFVWYWLNQHDMEGQLKLLPSIRQDGVKSRKLYAVPNKQTKPMGRNELKYEF